MICIFLGTRPEIIKMSPVINELQKKKINFFIIHTNQHFSENMDKHFFEELNLPAVKYNLKIKSKTRTKAVREIITKAEGILLKENPSVVLVQGDTNSVLGGAFCASKVGIKVGHIEAGLRSYDNNMPEEINRKLVDHISDFLFCPTDVQKKILLNEAVDNKKIFVTGNTIVDAVSRNIKFAKSTKYLKKNEKFIILTLHRPSNVDNKKTFSEIIKAVEILGSKIGVSVYFPIHPRTKMKLSKFSIYMNNNIYRILPPIGYLEMLFLEQQSSLILTDSGGIQEEACVLNVPCVTIRENTERPETLEVGSNMLVGTSSDKIIKGSLKMINSDRKWRNPYGDGKAAFRIVSILEKVGII